MCRTVWTFPSIVFKQPLLKVSRDASVMDRVARVADENVNVEKGVHWLACQAVVFGALREKVKMEARLQLRYGVAAFALTATLQSEGWARLDSNQGPRDYESPALPLSYRPVCILGIRTQSTAHDQRGIWTNFRGGDTTNNFQYFDSVKNYSTSRQAMFRRQCG